MSEADTIAKLTIAAAGKAHSLIDQRGVEHFFVPKGNGAYEMILATPEHEVKPRPAYINQGVQIHQVSSLIEYVNAFRTDSTAIFASYDNLKISAVIDYHQSASLMPGLVKHVVTLGLTYSPQWSFWKDEANGQNEFTQRELAQLIQLNAVDFLQPSGTKLLEMLMDMRNGVTTEFNSMIETPSGPMGETGGSRRIVGSTIPDLVELHIPVFLGENAVPVTININQDIDPATAKSTFTMAMIRSLLVEMKQFETVIARIRKETGLQVFMGAIFK
jgi:hypothetical protein